MQPITYFEQGTFKINSVMVSNHDLFQATLCARPQGEALTLWGTTYTSLTQLQTVAVDVHDIDCAEYRDAFGHPVLRIVEDVPCFDDSDYAYDQYHFIYFVVGSPLAAVCFSKGSRGFSDLRVYMGITKVNPIYEKKVHALGDIEQR